jgi:hypothetical protein
MDYMFSNAESFNFDISSWCVEDIPTAPTNFSQGCPLHYLYKPDWGQACP